MRKNLKVVQVSEVLYIVDIEADIVANSWYIVYNVSGYPLLYQCKRVEGDRVYYGDITSDAKEACERIIASVPNYSSINENIASVDTPRWTDADMRNCWINAQINCGVKKTFKSWLDSEYNQDKTEKDV